MYKIIGIYNGRSEVLDEASNKKEANYLVSEYRMAYGVGWHIYKSRTYGGLVV